MKTTKEKGSVLLIFTILVILLAVIGEIRCIYKTVTCNWYPIGKAEVIYTIGTFTGFGSIIGWIDIEDK
jgi:hypothetical protein